MNPNELFNTFTDQEKSLVKTILKRAETECIKCAMWDEAAKIYGKRGMCEECFNASFFTINCNTPEKES